MAVDGRGASGKSTLANRIGAAVPDSSVLHTDDIAWNESFFDWHPLLREHILLPCRDGQSVHFQPPAWPRHGRTGSIDIPAGRSLIVIEGVGASQRALTDVLDVSLWVQSDFALAEERGIARDIAGGDNGDAAETIAFWHEWMDEELPFLAAERPWERAAMIVAGTPPFELGPDEVAVAPPFGQRNSAL